MSEKDIYQKKMRAQLDEWKAELAKYKAKAEGASADSQLELNKEINKLEEKIKDGEDRLKKLSEAGEDAWKTVKDGTDAAWESLRSAFQDAASKFKK